MSLNKRNVLDTSCNFSDIQREEEKVKRSIKDAAKKGQKDVCIILAKEMIQSKKAVNKLYVSKAQMNSVLLNMKNQLGEYGLQLHHIKIQSLRHTSHCVNSVSVCPASCVKNGWCVTEKHGGHEGHAEPGQNP